MHRKNSWKKMMLLTAGCCLSAVCLTAAQEGGQTLTSGELTIENATGLEYEKLLVKTAEEEDWSADLAEDASFVPEDGTVYDLKLESRTGDAEIFYNLVLSDLSEVRLCERKDGAFYVDYIEKDDEDETKTERYAVTPREDAQTCYAKVRLNVREWPDTSSEVLRILSIGEEITVCGDADVWPESAVEESETEVDSEEAAEEQTEEAQEAAEGQTEEVEEAAEDLTEEVQEAAENQTEEAQEAAEGQTEESIETESWYLIRNGEGYGYVYGAYVTDDKEEADRLIAEEQARLQAEAEARAWAAAQAQAAAEAEAQAQAQAAAKAQAAAQKQKEQNKKEEKTVVKKEKVPGCDDPNHGMLYITYSDGSVDAKEY